MAQDLKLRTVLFADLVGFSRLSAENQTATFAFMNQCFKFATDQAAKRDGELVKTMGDGFLLLFERPTTAVLFSLLFHRFVAQGKKHLRREYIFRIGIHMGEVQRDKGDVFGNVVNIASRLEGKADPGHSLISLDVFRQVKDAVDCRFESMGTPVLKNIKEPIGTFKIVDERRQSKDTVLGELKIHVINKLSVDGIDGRVQLPESKAARALLGCLALSRDMGETQRRLAALLWPDETQESAAKELRNTWNELASLFNDPNGTRLAFIDDRVELNAREVSVDLSKMLDKIGVGEVDDLLVEGVEWSEALAPSIDQFNEVIAGWANVTRARWRDNFAGAMETNLERFEPTDNGLGALAKALLRIEPGHEKASAKLMSHFAALGNRAGALREFQRLQSYLQDTFGIEPGPDTLAVVQSLQAKEAASDGDSPSIEMPSATRRDIKIVVEPFSAMTGELEHRWFGFRAELMANLARFREWTLLERDAGENEKTPSAGVESDYRLSGTGTGESGLELSLFDSPSGRSVWRRQIDIELSNWHQEQLRVIGDIAGKLEIYVSKDRLVSTLENATTETSSLDDWLRAEFLLANWTPDSEKQGEALLRQLTKRDPSFAPAHASLASIYNVDHIIHPGRNRDAEKIETALRISQRAVELDSMDARNHLALAWSLALAERWDQALIHLDLVVQLNPNSPKAMISAAMGYCFFGDRYKATQLARQGMAAAPILPGYLWCYIATVLFFAEDYETVLAATEKANDAIADNQGWRAAAFAALGYPTEARASFMKMVKAVAPTWAGENDPSPKAVLEWFCNAYPIRDTKTKNRLKKPLEGALHGL